MRRMLKKKGIIWTTSSPYTLQSNELAERTNRKLVDKARTLVKHAALPDGFGGEVLDHVANLHTRTATLLLHMKTIVKLLLGKISNISKLWTFGCTAYVHGHNEDRKGKLVNRWAEDIYIYGPRPWPQTWLSLYSYSANANGFSQETCVDRRRALTVHSRKKDDKKMIFVGCKKSNEALRLRKSTAMRRLNTG